MLEHQRLRADARGNRREEPQGRARRAAVTALARVVAGIDQYQCQHVAGTFHIHHRQCERTGLAGKHLLVGQPGQRHRAGPRFGRGERIRGIGGHVLAVRPGTGNGAGRNPGIDRRGVEAAGEFPVDRVELIHIEPALKIVVAVGDGERHAALDQRGEELADGLARQLARLLQLRGTALGRRTALGEAVPRTDARGLRAGGLLLVAPAPLAERGGEGRVVSGDLVAAEYDDIGAGRVERGLDQTDRVLGHFRPVLNVGDSAALPPPVAPSFP